MPLAKHYHLIYEEYDKPLKTTCKWCSVFVRYSGRIGEPLYITFIHYGISTIGIYPEDIVPENFYFWWPAITKMQRICQRIFKEDVVIINT